MPVDSRTNAERHAATASELERALRTLKAALKEQGDLEQSAAIRDLIDDTERAIDWCERYAGLHK